MAADRTTSPWRAAARGLAAEMSLFIVENPLDDTISVVEPSGRVLYTASSWGALAGFLRAREHLPRQCPDGVPLKTAGVLPDGSGFATASLPLPTDHWVYLDTGEPPGAYKAARALPDLYKQHALNVKLAARYAVRCATRSGKDADIDPDALVQAMIVGLFGYHNDIKETSK